MDQSVFELVEDAHTVATHPVIAHKHVVPVQLDSEGIEFIRNVLACRNVVVVDVLSLVDMKVVKELTLVVERATPLVHVVAHVQFHCFHVEIKALNDDL